MGNRENELTASDIMQVVVKSVAPTMTLPDLEAEFLSAQVSGFPVVEDGRLVGVVSRSDIVRTICSEREIAQKTSDFYFDETGFHESQMESLGDIAARVGQRLDGLTVQDVMVGKPHIVTVDRPLSMIARRFVDHHIHRLLVVDEHRLVGIITTMDLVRMVANHRLKCVS